MVEVGDAPREIDAGHFEDVLDAKAHFNVGRFGGGGAKRRHVGV